MKQRYYLMAWPLLLIGVACSSLDEPSGTHSEHNCIVTIRAVTDNQYPQSRGGSEDVSDPPPTRYVIEYTDDHGTVNRVISADGNFNLKLKYAERYFCSFWADNGKGYDTSDLTAVTVIEQPDMAAYYGNTEIQAGISSNETYTVTLSHAVARVDLIQKDDFTQTPIQLNMVTNKSFSLNVATGVANATDKTIKYTFKDIRQNNAGECIGSAYFIAPTNEAALTTMTFSMEGEGTSNEVSNVPLRKNFVTKITGNFSNLYKSDVGVSIDDNWKSTYNVEFWDGVSTSVPRDYANGETSFYITNPNELAWLAQESAKDGMTFEGYTIYIDRDIHLNNKEWIPIGLNSQGFKGRIIGQGYRINELKITAGTYMNVGLFASVTDGGRISQLDVYGDINLDSPAEETNIGGVIGKMSGASLFSVHSYVNINVANGQSCNVGGLIGTALDCDLFSIYTCEDINATGSRMHVGGIIGTYTAKDYEKSGTAILQAAYHESGVVSISDGQYNTAGGLIGFFRGDNKKEVCIQASYNKSPVIVNNNRSSICSGLVGSCNGYTTSKLEIWGCENTSLPIISQSSDTFFGEIVGQAQVNGGYTIKLTQPRISGNVVVGQCYIDNENSQIIYNGNTFTGNNGTSIYK